MFRVLAFEAVVTCGRMVLCLSSKEHSCVASINVFEIFGEGSGQLKPVWASIAIQGAELAGRPFWRSCRSACTSTWKVREVKSDASIGYLGLFWARLPGVG